MKKFLLTALLLASMSFFSCNGQNGEKETEVLLETTAGDIRIKLYNDTPGHRDNFIKNVKEGMYNDVSFHRVIRNFMIQTGDPDTRTGNFPKVEPADSITPEGEAITVELGPSIPAEIVYPRHFHQRGVVAAAREGDDLNPEKRSSQYQFYIVTGKFQNEEQLAAIEDNRYQRAIADLIEKKMMENSEELESLRIARDTKNYNKLRDRINSDATAEIAANPPKGFTQDQKRAYRSKGGAPWLDADYTVFGEVVEGMKTVQTIERTRTDKNDVPVTDIRIIRASVVE